MAFVAGVLCVCFDSKLRFFFPLLKLFCDIVVVFDISNIAALLVLIYIIFLSTQRNCMFTFHHILINGYVATHLKLLKQAGLFSNVITYIISVVPRSLAYRTAGRLDITIRHIHGTNHQSLPNKSKVSLACL